MENKEEFDLRKKRERLITRYKQRLIFKWKGWDSFGIKELEDLKGGNIK